MLGGIDEADAVRGILEEGRARGHVRQDPRLPLATEIGVGRAVLGDQLHQTGRLVGVELVADEDPLALRVGRHGGGDVGDEVGLGAGVTDGCLLYTSRRG